jgi:hypothetical protein
MILLFTITNISSILANYTTAKILRNIHTTTEPSPSTNSNYGITQLAIHLCLHQLPMGHVLSRTDACAVNAVTVAIKTFFIRITNNTISGKK